VFVCGKKNMLLLTWTVNYKVIASRLDTALKEIADSAATGAAQASDDLASKDRQRRLEQITTAQMRERCCSEADQYSYLHVCAHIQ